MKKYVAEIAGSLVIFFVAAAVGLTHNAVRGNSLPLIQKVNQAGNAGHADDLSDETGLAGIGNPIVQEVLREGSVTADQLKELLDTQSAMVIDARSPGEFEEARIAGAVNIPHDQLPEYMNYLLEQIPMDALVVCYCQGPDCDFSDLLATELKILGYPTVVLFPGGWEHWEAAGYPAEGTKVKN